MCKSNSYIRQLYISSFNFIQECDESKMTEEEHRVVEKYVIEGRLNGLDLSDQGQEILATIHNNLAEEKKKFKKRVEVSNIDKFLVVN